MNTAILIFTLILFGLVLFFAVLYLQQIQKAKERMLRHRIIKLTNDVNLIKNKAELIGNSSDKKPATIKSPSFIDNMENNAIKKLKNVVVVGDKERKVG